MSAAEPAWRERVISRSVDAARSRAEERIQRFVDAAFELVDEKGSTDFTVQDLLERSKQSLRGFYEYFGSKDELVLALFEETVREAGEDIRLAVAGEDDPIARLRAFVVTLHEWCDPVEEPRKRGAHTRRPISELSMQLAANHADRFRAALIPVTHMLRDLVDEAANAGLIHVDDRRAATALVQQTVMYSWFGNRLVEKPERRVDAEATWECCRRALVAVPPTR
jgi:AcrR family transcriptional regulator